jgi:hypothetical protein
MNERAAHWNYDLTGVTQSRRTSRVPLREPYCHELTGVDGTIEGVLRPFPGFLEVHRFDVTGWGSNHDSTSRVLEAKGVDFVIGDGGYGFGVVYRVQRKASGGTTLCDIFIDYYNSKLGLWNRSELLVAGVNQPREYDVETGQQMNVVPQGRSIYVFVEGTEPVYFACGRTTPWAAIVRSDTGPGKQALLASPDAGLALGSIIDTLDADRPGKGQVYLTQFSADSLSSVGASGPLTITGWGETLSEDFRQLLPGDYAFAYVLYNSDTGLHTGLSEVAQARKDDFTPGGGLYVSQYAFMEICYDTDLYDQAYIYRSVRVQDAGGTYIAGILHLEGIIDLADWHSRNNPIATPDEDLAQAIYCFQLEDKQLVFQDTFSDRALYDDNMPKGGCAHWYENTMLVSNIPIAGASTTDENRPGDATGGLGEVRWSTLTDPSAELFPPTNRYTPRIPSNTIIAFQPAGANVLGFSRDRQYHIRKESAYIKVQEIHEGFGVVNSWASETVGSLIYFVSPKGLKAVDSQAQLDDVASINAVIISEWKDKLLKTVVAFDPFLSLFVVANVEGDNDSEAEAYFFWFNTGMVTRLEDLPFSFVCRAGWPIDFAYDLSDLTTSEGVNNDTYKNPLAERALFVQNAPHDASETTSGFSPRLLLIDYKRERTQGSGTTPSSTRTTLMPFSGDSVFAVGATFDSGSTITLTVGGSQVLPEDVWGARLYVLKAVDESLIGQSAKIRTRPSATTLSLGATQAANLYGLAVGDIVGLSPVHFRGVFWPLGSEPEEGKGNDFFRVRHMDSVGCLFSDVGGTSSGHADDIDRFRALAYLGAEADPVATAETRDTSNNLVKSVEDHEGLYWAGFGPDPDGVLRGRTGVDGSVLTPGVEIFCPDLDYSLVAVQVTGSWKGTNRTRRVS